MKSVPETIRLFGTASDSIVDGPGLRFAVFVQGCSRRCPGCHNPESQSADGGAKWNIEQLADTVLENRLIGGLTLSGGEPFEQAAACAELARRVRARGLSIWTYTGYCFEDLAACAQLPGWQSENRGALSASFPVDADGARALLEQIDVLVDGPFVQKLSSYDLMWRGSSNQRLIDVVATIKAKRVVLWEPYDFVPPMPASW